jgi:hypothetical protein
VDIRSAQERVWANKQVKGFNTTDVALEFGLLTKLARNAGRVYLPDAQGILRRADHTT